MVGLDVADRYWRQYLDSLPESATRPECYYDTTYFGSKPEDGLPIAKLVLDGTKTATGSVLWAYEHDGKRPPQPGDLTIIEDGYGNPLCIIETTEVRILSLDEVDAAFAYDGGEWDRTLPTWQKNYREYIEQECARIGREYAADAPLVCERFRVVYREPLV